MGKTNAYKFSHKTADDMSVYTDVPAVRTISVVRYFDRRDMTCVGCKTFSSIVEAREHATLMTAALGYRCQVTETVSK